MGVKYELQKNNLAMRLIQSVFGNAKQSPEDGAAAPALTRVPLFGRRVMCVRVCVIEREREPLITTCLCCWAHVAGDVGVFACRSSSFY